MNKHKVFVGDTLVEVMFAVGIFCTVVVGVITLMNSSSNKVQNSLELTMTRNEIDIQAEALRFIQSSYIAERDNDEANRKYSKLWTEIKNHAVPDTEVNSILTYQPSTCSALYQNDGEAKKYGFILNTRKLNEIKNVLYDGKTSSVLKQASLYPRLIFGSSDELYAGTNISNNITAAEGLYIIAVRDSKTDGTISVGTDGNTSKKQAYYDFYIRSCWDAPGSNVPTTTSTVIRLYDPDIETVNYQLITFSITYDGAGGSPVPYDQTGNAKAQYFPFNIPLTPTPIKTGSNFLGWGGNGWKEGDACTRNTFFLAGSTINVPYDNPNQTLRAVYQCPYSITFYANGAQIGSYKELRDDKTYKFNYPETYAKTGKGDLYKDGYTFVGWASKPNQYDPETYSEELSIVSNPIKTDTQAYAAFRPNYVINYVVDGDAANKPTGPTICTSETKPKNCQITSAIPTRTGYKFSGWSTSKNASNVEFRANSVVSMPLNNNYNITLYAVWNAYNETIKAELRWGETPRDLDSHCVGVKADGAQFHAYYGSKIGNDIDGTIIAQLDKDVTTGFGPENLIINTRGGRNYYYYVYNWSSNSTITGATVTITNETTGAVYTVRSNEGTGSGRYWHIFTYKDGEIIITNKHDGTADVAR